MIKLISILVALTVILEKNYAIKSSNNIQNNVIVLFEVYKKQMVNTKGCKEK